MFNKKGGKEWQEHRSSWYQKTLHQVLIHLQILVLMCLVSRHIHKIATQRQNLRNLMLLKRSTGYKIPIISISN